MNCYSIHAETHMNKTNINDIKVIHVCQKASSKKMLLTNEGKSREIYNTGQ